MGDTKKVVLIIFSVVFVITVSLLGYYLYLVNHTTPIKTPAPEAGIITPKINTPGDPITKYVYGHNEGVYYELEGSFADKPGKNGSLISGVFVVKGDKAARKINVLAGALDGTIYTGSYQGSFQGSSTWVNLPVDQVLPTISAGQPVLLRYIYRFRGGKEDEEKVKQLEGVFDKLSEEIKSGQAELKIPSTFVIIAEALGVIR